MSRNRNRNGKAKKSNFVGRVAMVIKEGDKNKGQRVAIKAVNNDIAEVFLLSDVEMKTFCIPLDGLHIYSQERGEEYYIDAAMGHIFGLMEDVLKRDVNNIRNGGKGGNNDNKPSERMVKPQEPSDDSADNFLKHILEASELLTGCSKFCRDYKVSPIYFVSRLSEHLYSSHERYAPNDNK